MLVTRHSLVPSLMKVNLYTTIANQSYAIRIFGNYFLKFENFNILLAIIGIHCKANTNSFKPSYCYKWNKQCLSKDFEHSKQGGLEHLYI